MEQSKIKLEELFFELLVQTFAFVIFFSFYTFNPFVCFLFLFLFVLTCLSSLGCQNVCLSDSTLFLFFQGFLGKYLRMHNFVYTRRLDYAHAGLFMRAQATTQKPSFRFLLGFLCFCSHVMPLIVPFFTCFSPCSMFVVCLSFT